MAQPTQSGLAFGLVGIGAAEVLMIEKQDLSQTEGPAVVVSVGTFVDRLKEMSKTDGGFGKNGKEARKLLAKRGLTANVLEHAEALIEKVQTIERRPEPPNLEEQRAALTKAEDAMWAWYLEWGAIARSSIKDRGVLRQLGFLSSGRGRVVEDEVEEPTTASTPTPATDEPVE